jgi:ankyrin repeat protein
VCCWNNNCEVVKLLLEQNALNADMRNYAGKTALDLAKEKNFQKIIWLLEQKR